MNIKINGKNITAQNEATIEEIITFNNITTEKEPLAVRVDNCIYDLRYIPTQEDEIKILTIDSQEGYRAYRQTMFFVFMSAVKAVFPSMKIILKRSINKSTYCEVYGKILADKSAAASIENEMRRIIDANMPINKICVTQKQTEEIFLKEGEIEKSEFIRNSQRKNFNLYTIGAFHFMIRGTLCTKTGIINKLHIFPYENGFMLCYPTFLSNGEIPEFQDSKRLIKAIEDYRVWGDVLNLHTVNDLNEAILNGKINELILIQESFHEKKLSEIATSIVKHSLEKKIVLITGPSSSGKTTFANRLNIHLRVNGLSPVTLSMDDYFLNRANSPRHADGTYNFECPEALDYALFNKHLTKLLEGEEVEVPIYNFRLGEREPVGKKMRLKSNQIILAEGINALNEKLSYQIPWKNKFKIYVSPLTELQIDDMNPVSPTDTRIIRRMVRDYKFRASSPENTLSMWQSVQDGEIKYIFPYEEKADIIFNSFMMYEFCMFKPIAEKILRQVPIGSIYFSEALRLLELFSYFTETGYENVPSSSILREFIGGSSFI